MQIDDDVLQRLVAAPTEGLNSELKTWLDLGTDDGQEKIVRAVASPVATPLKRGHRQRAT
jgi:hypothetical protein